jgi:peroxiredoxin
MRNAQCEMNKAILIFLAMVSFIPGLSAQALGTDIGNKAPEIRLPSLAGDTIALSSTRGKLVLIDFWATWCAPCVNEQPELAELYKKFKHTEFTKGKGFEIFAVSLDSKRANWEGMIAKLYKIQELPFNLLIDSNGIILAKNLHGAELENELAKYLLKK